MPKNYIKIEKSWLRVVDWGFLNFHPYPSACSHCL